MGIKLGSIRRVRRGDLFHTVRLSQGIAPEGNCRPEFLYNPGQGQLMLEMICFLENGRSMLKMVG